MPLFRESLLFAVTTRPTDLVAAAAHSGGWSESVWTEVADGSFSSADDTRAQARAKLLPVGASVIGYRIEQFTISGNKLLPGGASSGRLQYPGTVGTINLPSDSLMCNGRSNTSANTTRFSLRGIPDTQIANGEYQPDATFKLNLAEYFRMNTAYNYGFVGRIRGTTARVNHIAGAVVTLSEPVGGVAQQSYLRMLRVYDNAGRPVKGSFLITLIAGNDYTLQGLPPGTSLTTPSGNARLDGIAYYQFGNIVPNRAVGRKIGGPFERYRGRASRRR